MKKINEEMTETVNAVEKDYQVGDQAEKWAEGVLSQIRRQTVSIKCMIQCLIHDCFVLSLS